MGHTGIHAWGNRVSRKLLQRKAQWLSNQESPAFRHWECQWTEYYRNFFNLCNLDSGKLHNKSFFDKVSGKNNVKYGTHLTQEQKDRISKKLTGRKISRDIVEKVANSNRGKHHNSEWCRHISEGNRGRKKISTYG